MADTYQRLAATRPASTSEAEFYVVPASTEIIGYVHICNQDTEQRTFSLAHTDTSGAAAGEDWLYYGATLGAGCSVSVNVMMGAAETLRVVASVADKISFVLAGLKVA